MMLILSLVAEIVCLAAAIAASYLLLLVYRNPHRPKWLDSESASATLSITAMSVLILILSWFVSSLVQLGANPVTAIAVVAGLFVFLGWVLWKLLGVAWRLEETRQGRTPFAGRGQRGIKGGGFAGQA